MKTRKLMGIIGVLAIITWLVVPAARIWRDPTLRLHRHTLGSPNSLKRLTLVMGSPAPAKWTRLKVGVLTIDHRATFWDRYRDLLLGGRWPPGEGCADWKSIQDKFHPEGSKADREFEMEIQADRMTIAL